MTTEMEPYDGRAWAEIEKWREGRLTARGRRLVPGKVRAGAAAVLRAGREKFDSLPGAENFEALFRKALGGLIDLGSRAAMASVGEKAIVKAFQKRGHDVGA